MAQMTYKDQAAFNRITALLRRLKIARKQLDVAEENAIRIWENCLGERRPPNGVELVALESAERRIPQDINKDFDLLMAMLTDPDQRARPSAVMSERAKDLQEKLKKMGRLPPMSEVTGNEEDDVGPDDVVTPDIPVDR